MDYFPSSGNVVGVESINEITMQPIETFTYNINLLKGILYNFISTDTLSFVDIPLLWIIFIQVLVIVWVLKDSNYRSSNTFFCFFSVLLVTIWTPFIWLPIYLAIRPLGYKHERRYWKAVSKSMGKSDIAVDEKIYVKETEDEQYISELRKQVSLAKKRTKKAVIKEPIIKKSVSKSSTVKKIPTPKNPITKKN
jgi:hypothetical protein